MPFVRPARETAKARRVDHLFATEAPQPQRTEAPAEPARPRDPAVVEGETQVRELLRRIEEFRARIPRPPEAASYEPSNAEDALESESHVREHPSAAEEPIDDIPESQWTTVPEAEAPHTEPQLAVHDFRWETDTSGMILWVDGIAREAVIGRTVALSEPEAIEGVDMKVATAFARRAPFRDGRLRLPGSGEASGVWMISGVPFFDPRGGRFCGFRGTARRVQEDVAVAAEEVASPTPAAPTILVERRQEQKEPPSPDAIRQMTHELRTTLNAIVGFAEMIDRSEEHTSELQSLIRISYAVF